MSSLSVKYIILYICIPSLVRTFFSPQYVTVADLEDSYFCDGSSDYKITPRGISGATCDCGELISLSAGTPIAQPNMTDPSDPQQCVDYVLISARGTLEPQGLSRAFDTMTMKPLQYVPNGAFYNVKYPASLDQNSIEGTRDLVDSIRNGLSTCPNQAYALYGFSRGAAVVIDALPEFSDEMFRRVKAVILAGNPYRVPGKLSNVNGNGIRTERSNDAVGVHISRSNKTGEILGKWDESGKVLDICVDDDGICNSVYPCSGLTINHFFYEISQRLQALGTKHVVVNRLRNEAASD